MQCVKNFQAPCVACGDCRPPRGEAPCRCEDCGATLTKQACFAFSDFADWHFFCERCAARHFFHCTEEDFAPFCKACAFPVIYQVKVLNAAAVALYHKWGFLPVGRRKNYYTAPTEDAILMTVTL